MTTTTQTTTHDRIDWAGIPGRLFDLAVWHTSDLTGPVVRLAKVRIPCWAYFSAGCFAASLGAPVLCVALTAAGVVAMARTSEE